MLLSSLYMVNPFIYSIRVRMMHKYLDHHPWGPLVPLELKGRIPHGNLELEGMTMEDWDAILEKLF